MESLGGFPAGSDGKESERSGCNPMDYTIHGILQARILECVAFPFSRGSSQPRSSEPQSLALQADSLPAEPPGKPKNAGVGSLSLLRGNLPDPGMKLVTPELKADPLSLLKYLPAMQETWVGKTPWRKEWLLTPVFLLGEFHGQMSLVS